VSVAARRVEAQSQCGQHRSKCHGSEVFIALVISARMERNQEPTDDNQEVGHAFG